ncbi:MAG: amidohydrolase [Marinilabiliaceae bacterium]|jgi:hippurate hydrolase|nr:amidohydrolase [Marinilabiliaceae bacterium]
MRNTPKTLLICLILILTCNNTFSQENKKLKTINDIIEANINNHRNIYTDLHRNPELSLMEFETSKKMAAQLRKLGFDVTENVGGNGVVGVLKNGKGPTVMLRTDMDALPISENTGLEYASKVVMKNMEGQEMPVMHACGHDMHMTLWLGTLTTLSGMQKEWNGTLVAIAQPAEEISGGSSKMLADGLFSRFPTPDYALAYHVAPDIPAGKIGYSPGPIFAGVTNADIYVYGIGGHGALPQTTIDPIVLSAHIISRLQTIVSREIDPVAPAVVTVGSIHGGTKHNIIPEEVKMQLTLRFFSDEVYRQIEESINRICEGEALAAGVPAGKLPLVLIGDQYTPPVVNDPGLVNKAVLSMQEALGEENIFRMNPATVAEDFGKYGLTKENVKIALFMCGSTEAARYENTIKSGQQMPGLHNPSYYPDFEPTYRAGVKAMSATIVDLFNNN